MNERKATEFTRIATQTADVDVDKVVKALFDAGATEKECREVLKGYLESLDAWFKDYIRGVYR